MLRLPPVLRHVFVIFDISRCACIPIESISIVIIYAFSVFNLTSVVYCSSQFSIYTFKNNVTSSGIEIMSMSIKVFHFLSIQK